MQVSVTVPHTRQALSLAAEFLNKLAACEQADPAQLVAAVQAGPTSEPTPAPVAATTPAPTPEPLAPTPGAVVELDSEGFPWDERIHSSTRSRLASGAWKLKRGVDDKLVEQVKAEHNGAPAPTPAPTPTPAPAPVPTPAPIPAPVKVLQVTALATHSLEAYATAGWSDEALIAEGLAEYVELTPAPAPVPTPAPAPTPQPGPTGAITKQDFTTWCLERTKQQVFTSADVAQACAAVMGAGKTMADLMKEPHHVPAVHAALVAKFGA